MTDRDTVGFVPPPYPYDRLDAYQKLAAAHDGGIVDLSIGTPCDPPPPAVIEALSQSNSERGYPASIGSEALRLAEKMKMPASKASKLAKGIKTRGGK